MILVDCFKISAKAVSPFSHLSSLTWSRLLSYSVKSFCSYKPIFPQRFYSLKLYLKYLENKIFMAEDLRESQCIFFRTSSFCSLLNIVSAIRFLAGVWGKLGKTSPVVISPLPAVLYAKERHLQVG